MGTQYSDKLLSSEVGRILLSRLGAVNTFPKKVSAFLYACTLYILYAVILCGHAKLCSCDYNFKIPAALFASRLQIRPPAQVIDCPGLNLSVGYDLRTDGRHPGTNTFRG